MNSLSLTSDSGPASTSAEASYPWYAVRVKSKFEFVTTGALRDKGFEQFLPSYRSKRQWSDRVKEVELPLFPGYVFCRLDAARPYDVLNSPGVVHIVSAGKTPIAVDHSEVAALQTMCRSGLAVEPWPFVQEGQRVTIERGPLTGAEGVISAVKNEVRLVVSITLLQRSVATEVERSWIRAA
jgi:transcription termination/antitermination protein NusG